MPRVDPDGCVPIEELATLAEIGRAILASQLDEDQLCELVYELAGHIVPTDDFQLGLFDADQYRIKVWIKEGRRQPPAAFEVPEGHGIVGWLRATRQALLVHDFEVELAELPARPTYISDHPPRSAIFLPLSVADTVIGAVSVQSALPNAFEENHLRLLAVLANQSASAINNARLYERGQQRLHALQAVSEVSRKLASILDLNQLLTQVVELIQSRFGYYHVQIFLVERDSDRAQFKASSGSELNEKWQREGRSMRIGEEGIIGWVAQHGEPLLANDVSQEPRYCPDDQRLLPDTHAELAMPLLVEGEVVGVLDVQSTRVGAFGENDAFILSMLADQVAVAVNSARAFEAQREEAWVTTVMLQVADATSQAESVDAVLDAAVRVTAMLAGVTSCTIWLWDEEFLAFQYGASYGLWPAQSLEADPAPALRFLVGEWPVLDRLRVTKAAMLTSAHDLDMPELMRVLCPGGAVALLPMLNKGAVFGVLGASFSENGDRPNDRRLSMLSGIAHQVAAAVDSSRQATAREEEAWISTILLQVAEAISRLQPVDITLEQVARLAPAVTGVDRCAVLLRGEDGNFHVRTAHALRGGLADAYRDAIIAPSELPLLDDACTLGQPLVVEDAYQSPRVPDAWRARFGSRTILVVPLLVADEVIGALVADDVETTHMFSERRVRILSGIASQAAIALENARLQAQESERVRLARELELAQAIQQSLLPQEAPSVPGYQIAYRWVAAREVGGDIFDFVLLPLSNLGLVIADVSGKGIPAALYMMFARTLLRAVAFSGREPAAMLIRTNELMMADSTSDYFVTAYYSLLDVRQHTLTYASAGHNLAAYIPASGDPVQPMITKGIPLGVIPEAEIEQKRLALAPGDVVVFYTDGVSEAMNASDEEFGSERLFAVLHAQRGQSAEAIADAIQTAVRDFAGNVAQHDDFTLLVLKRDEASSQEGLTETTR
jgi:serine phosphatase RsbU (regulator of sigma subunit)